MNQGKKWVLVSVLLAVVMLTVAVKQAQCQIKYPTRAIDFYVPTSPGGAIDLSARVTAAYLNKKWGVPVNVINKPGGNFVPGTLEVYIANPDGYTMLADSNPTSSLLDVAVKNLPFKTMDRTFIATTTTCPGVYMVPIISPIKSLKDLEDVAKRNPEQFTWTSSGGSSNQDYSIRQFIKNAGVDVMKTKPIMVTGGAQSATLTAGGHVVLGWCAISSALPPINSGNARGLAVTSKERYPDLPNIPTTAELGYPMLNVVHWNAVAGPPKLPSYIVDIWDKALQEVLKDPEVLTKLASVGLEPFYSNASAYKELVRNQLEQIGELYSGK
jgi:tripartite-type tricarboxylate transporter receptor subunit TctC